MLRLNRGKVQRRITGYHPRMVDIHRENARQLRVIIETVGWPSMRQ